jgi:hypothetical protein
LVVNPELPQDARSTKYKKDYIKITKHVSSCPLNADVVVAHY